MTHYPVSGDEFSGGKFGFFEFFTGLIVCVIHVYLPPMYTVIETQTFQKQADKLWTESERLAFIEWIAVNPLAGDVIPGADGARKVRWSCGNHGKRGGVRVIYFNLCNQGHVVLVLMYAKNEQSNINPGDIPHGH